MKLMIPPKFIEQVNVYIMNNLSREDLNTSNLAHFFNLSESQITRKIKCKTGLTPIAYIRCYRLKRAKQLIESSDLTLTEIALQSGFSTLSYFSRCFSEHYGYPPSSIKKTMCK